MKSGEKLGPYEIAAPLGKGGMGEVFRARDTRLGRTVAIKVCAEQFSDRFEREARAIAALNHPNICALYDVGPNYLVMEYVEGETLQGPLSMNKAVKLGSQICEALEEAHEKGIVHRDLKPANIKVTPEGKVKVLDFGLAKAFRDVGPDAPTQTEVVGSAVVVMGTGPYMSPEQARGEAVDKRTDIWAFGCVLYEMLCGKRAFGAIGAVLAAEPDWGALPGGTPENVRAVLLRCLQKDRDERLHDIADARLELKERPAAVHRRAAHAPVTAWIAAGLFCAIALALALIHFRERPPERQAVKLALMPPEKTSFNDIAVSPDGRLVAFTARDVAGRIQLRVRPLDGLAAPVLGGTEGASFPFWSPDSRWIGYFAGGKLKKVAISGGPPQELADAPIPRGGSWSREGIIVYAPNATTPLMQVPASGGEPKAVTEFDASGQERSHRWPRFLPGGRRFLYLIRGGKEQEGIYAGSLHSKEKKRLLASPSGAEYAMGHLLFVRERALLAQRFDAEKLLPAGEAFPVAEPVGVDAGVFRARFSVSETGVLAYDLGADAVRRLQWFDRGGKPLGSFEPAGDYSGVNLSPDGRRLATDRADPQSGNRDIWLYEVGRGASTRFTIHPAVDGVPVWSPDGRKLVFASSRESAFHLYLKDANAAGEESLLLETPANKAPTGWSPDGRRLMYEEVASKTGMDLWVLALDGPRPAAQPRPWLRSEFEERNGRFSPDGRWVAYESNESGRFEIYVRPFEAGSTGAAGYSAVSTGGGVEPSWRADGKEMYYLGPDRRLVAVEVKTAGDRFEAGAPRALFQTRAAMIAAGFYTVYTVTADGQRFMIITEGDEVVSQPATVVMNWTAGLKK
jgi:Tol biopolymer transport system component/predicted Ser/Thr protein kinase